MMQYDNYALLAFGKQVKCYYCNAQVNDASHHARSVRDNDDNEIGVQCSSYCPKAPKEDN